MDNGNVITDVASTPLPVEVGEALFARLPDPILVTDAKGRVTHRNPAAERLVGDADLERAFAAARRTPEQAVVIPFEEGWLEVVATRLTLGFLIRVQDVSALREREARIRQLVKATNDIIWWADPERGFVEPQEAWEEFTGQTFDEYKHWGHTNAIHPGDRERVQAAWAEAAAERRVCRCEYRVYCPAKEEYRHCMAKGVPLLRRDGTIREWIGTLTDIHELKAAQEALAALNRELEERVRERTGELEAFTYTVSHDLRAPLRGLIANSLILQESHPDLEEDSRRRLDRLVYNARHLAQLVDDLLEMTRLKRHRIERSRVDVSAVAESVCDTLGSTRGTPEHRFEVQAGLVADADPHLLRLALICLVDNAIKFSPQGGLIQVGEEEGRLVVRDHGIGFDPEYTERIFQPFERLHRHEFPGTGAGLANVKWIAERHGGVCGASPREGGGSEFWLTVST